MVDLTISQNFFKDSGLVRRLVGKVGISKGDTVLDIGAGEGIISEVLLETGASVIAVEPDGSLFLKLKQRFSGRPGIQLVDKDFLNYVLPSGPYKVFSNIPFSVTSSIVNKLLFAGNPPRESFLVIQQEAANRFMGKGEGYLFSLLSRPFFDTSVLYKFKKDDFIPKPSVDSVMLGVRKRSQPLIKHDLRTMYEDFICYVVSQQKPTLKLRLKKIFTAVQYYRISEDLRFSTEATVKDLTFTQWLVLFEKYISLVDASKKSETAGSYENYRKNILRTGKISKTRIHR